MKYGSNTSKTRLLRNVKENGFKNIQDTAINNGIRKIAIELEKTSEPAGLLWSIITKIINTPFKMSTLLSLTFICGLIIEK